MVRHIALIIALVLLPASLSLAAEKTIEATTVTEESVRMLEQFWLDEYHLSAGPASSVYLRELLAKASPDECFYGIGDERNEYLPGTFDAGECLAGGGKAKVNEAYVWGLTKSGDDLWFGTAPNVHCLVTGALEIGLADTTFPFFNESYVCEYGEGPYVPPLPHNSGDWRPPRMYLYNLTDEVLTDVTPADPLAAQISGLRSAGSLGKAVFLAGPKLSRAGGIAVFAYNTETREYLGSTTLADFNNIRHWLVADNVLYAAVGTRTGGAIIRWQGDPETLENLFDFEVVGNIDGDGAFIALHEGRIFVMTWPNFTGGTVKYTGLYMSPPVPEGGLTAEHLNDWQKVWQVTEYEPDWVTAAAYGGGAIASFDGYLYWGTMHVPAQSLWFHALVYGVPPDSLAYAAAMVGTYRAITIFRGKGFGTPEKEVDLLYGLAALPQYTKDVGWNIVPNTMGTVPLFGLSGFGNFFNNYTWTMGVYNNELFVGTMDWSYISQDLFIPLPEEMIASIPSNGYGADLFRFPSSSSAAIPESYDGVGNYSSYGIRTMIADDALYLGMANPMNLMTDPDDDRPEGGWELIRVAATQGPMETATALNQFWNRVYSDQPMEASPMLMSELLAKGQPDECYFGIGDTRNWYDPQFGNTPLECPEGLPKVNQAYVWGLTKLDGDIWFGTWTNGHIQSLGGMFGTIGLELPAFENDSWVSEYGQSQFSPPQPAASGDWRPPRIYLYSTLDGSLTEKTPPNALIQTTNGIRSAGTLGDVIFLAGPTSTFPSPEAGVNFFAFHARTGEYLGSTNMSQYNDIRQWLVVNGVLYTGVGSPAGGRILRWKGDVSNPFLFEEVGEVDGSVAYLAFHENRIFVTTWGLLEPKSGLWMSPELPAGGLTAEEAGSWTNVWRPSHYEPDPVTAMATLGGALASFDGYLFWGTMHIPFHSTLAHFFINGIPMNLENVPATFLGSYRPISIFRGRDFGTPEQEIDLLYGLSTMPVYQSGKGWNITSNKMGQDPLWGAAGFGNFYNNYAWTMGVYDDQLYVGTMDWSYIIPGMTEGLFGPLAGSLGYLPEMKPGADLFRFPSAGSQAVAEALDGVGNYSNYGIRTMVCEDGLFLGTANPMNLMTDLTDDKPEGGWELLRLTPESGCGGGVKGDVNADDRINVLDVVAAVRHLLGIQPLYVDGLCRLDCNGDGTVTVEDVMGVVSVITGEGDCAPGAYKRAVTPKAREFLQVLDSYFTEDELARFMKLVESSLPPTEYGLFQNYPNPFNPTTGIQFAVGSGQLAARVTLKIFNVLGQEVATLVDEVKQPGYYTVTWDASDMSSGVYFCRLTAGAFAETRRMVLMR